MLLVFTQSDVCARAEASRAEGMGTELLSALAIGGGGYGYPAARGIFAIANGWLAESAVVRFHMILASPRTAL